MGICADVQRQGKMLVYGVLCVYCAAVQIVMAVNSLGDLSGVLRQPAACLYRNDCRIAPSSQLCLPRLLCDNTRTASQNWTTSLLPSHEPPPPQRVTHTSFKYHLTNPEPFCYTAHFPTFSTLTNRALSKIQ